MVTIRPLFFWFSQGGEGSYAIHDLWLHADVPWAHWKARKEKTIAMCSEQQHRKGSPLSCTPLLRHCVFGVSRGRIQHCYLTVSHSDFNDFQMFHLIAIGNILQVKRGVFEM